ncbi:ThiF family adenylyltransferase [Demequina sp.]|uniref:ThiF family adenylyltransferase n=1 Tax=Demequina sp. TaxID=2050685 RepID=UPI003D14A1F5
MDVDPAFLAAHEDLVYELENLGFVEREPGHWCGALTTPTGDNDVEVRFEYPYPMRPPRVKVPAFESTWHQEVDGALCLWSESSPGHFPWLEPGKLVAKVVEWIANTEAGWAGGTADLDLERYWTQSTQYRLLILPDIGTIPEWIRLGHDQNQKLLSYKGSDAPRHAKSRATRHRNGYVVDIGEPPQPPRDWDGLAACLPNPDEVLELLQSRRVDVLVVRYSLAGEVGGFALENAAQGRLQPSLLGLPVAQDTEDVRLLRSGHLASGLGDKTVAVVGVGSVGSFVADGLARAGVRKLILIDDGRLRPGHLPRHAARGPVGWRKVDAMAAMLEPEIAINRVPTRVLDLDSARNLLEVADCVVDATANEVTTELLRLAAAEQGKQFVCTYLENDGQDLIADVMPIESGAAHKSPQRQPLAGAGVESGCGDLVSPTAPYAVQEAALMAVRVTLQLLSVEAPPARRIVREYSW